MSEPQPEIPNIKIPKMRSSGDDWCKHYAGFFNPGLKTGRKTHCDAGVEYDSVVAKVDFTTQRHHERTPYLHHEAHPCFRHQAHLAKPCAKCEFLSPQEVEAKHGEMMAGLNRITVIREAILQDLRRRFLAREPVTAPSDISRFNKPQTNYFCGSGVMDCPVCKGGKVHYSRSSYNGHVHARCSTEGCASWME